jgi:hypothetical protein
MARKTMPMATFIKESGSMISRAVEASLSQIRAPILVGGLKAKQMVTVS